MGRSDDNLIAWLGAAPASARLGGKGTSLDRLLRMGFRVPPAFCLTTDAFASQRAALGGGASLTSAGAGAGAEAGADREHRAEAEVAAGVPPWATSLAESVLAEDVASALRAALERLATELERAGIFQPRFAVRSSAIGEDGSAASYAGLHETELDVAAAEVPAAVTRCWASLWSPAALAYRRRRGIPLDDAAMAVVVQALVPADAAAVAFTRHPVTGREDQLVVTAVRGLGEAMVAGTVTPDTFVIDKASRVTIELDRGEDPHGISLDSPTLGALVDLALAVEDRFGAAVDIEAAWAGGTWWLLQARPITTGAPVGGRA